MRREGAIILSMLIVFSVLAISITIIKYRQSIQQPLEQTPTTIEVEYNWVNTSTTHLPNYTYVVIARGQEDVLFADMDKHRVLGIVPLNDIYRYSNYDLWESDKKNETDWWTSQGYGVLFDDLFPPPENSNFSVRFERILSHATVNNTTIAKFSFGRWDKEDTTVNAIVYSGSSR